MWERACSRVSRPLPARNRRFSAAGSVAQSSLSKKIPRWHAGCLSTDPRAPMTRASTHRHRPPALRLRRLGRNAASRSSRSSPIGAKNSARASPANRPKLWTDWPKRAAPSPKLQVATAFPRHTIINSRRSARRPRSAQTAALFRQPYYDCRDFTETITLSVYVPGVDAAGVDIEAIGPDLMITARKSHFVRVNWPSLHLEGAQRDYQLRLRLGLGFIASSLRFSH